MNKPHIIGIDARFYGEAGPGRYIKNILEHLEKIDRVNSYFVFLRQKGLYKYNPKNENFRKVYADSKWYSWREQTVFLAQVLGKHLDLFYVPHFNVPVLYQGKLVTAIPDIIMHSFSTEKGTTLPKPYFKFKKFMYSYVLEAALKKSSKIIVPTYDVYNDITNHYPGISKNKFTVAYEGVDPVFSSGFGDVQTILNKFGLTKEKYLLYISSMYEHKNVERLIQAFKVLLDRYSYEGKLVLIGKKDKFSERIFDLIRQYGLGSSVIMPGMTQYVTDEETICLRKNAKAYVFPSLKEGFSLTPLEAQYLGLPCVISNISCHREVFEDSVVYFDPFDVLDIADKIYSLISNPNLIEEIKRRGYDRVKKYDWLNTAKITLQVFNEVLMPKKAQ